MIWHIFRKDLQRLWPFVAALAALNLLVAVIQIALGVFTSEHSTLLRLADFLGLLSTILIFFAAVLVVQLDPIPDDRQDWLARPIRRRDLLAAKLLFMLLTVQAQDILTNADDVSIPYGGDDTISNLVLLHPNCHRQVHSAGLVVEKAASREGRS